MISSPREAASNCSRLSVMGDANMDWVWKQTTGEMFRRGSPVTSPFATGYAGYGALKNDPASQCVSDLGPIPRGWYTILPETDDPAPVTLPLEPDPANDMCGRTGFLIHADNVVRPGTASQGCIVIGNRAKREAIRDSGSDRLEVIE